MRVGVVMEEVVGHRPRYLARDLPRIAAITSAMGLASPEVPGAPRRPPAVPLITNVMGSTAQEFSRLVEACGAREEIAALELNVSCPNVKTGLDIGADPGSLEEVVRAWKGIKELASSDDSPLLGQDGMCSIVVATFSPAQ